MNRKAEALELVNEIEEYIQKMSYQNGHIQEIEVDVLIPQLQKLRYAVLSIGEQKPCPTESAWDDFFDEVNSTK